MSRHEWRDRAACAGMAVEVFFDDGMLDVAREKCQGCPVRQQCLDDALLNGENHGIRGGLVPAERRDLSVGVCGGRYARHAHGKYVWRVCQRTALHEGAHGQGEL